MDNNQGASAEPTGPSPSGSSQQAVSPVPASVPCAYERTPWLHIRCQFTYHAVAEIVGTRDGLIALRMAVDDALTHGEGEEQAFASDGEGYELRIRRSSTVGGLGKPTYLDEEARHLSYMERDYLVRESKSRKAVEKEAFDALRWCRQNGDPHAIAMETRRAETTGSVAKR